MDRLPVPLAVFPGLAMPWRIPPALELERVSVDRPPGSTGAPRRRYGQRPAPRLASDLQQRRPAWAGAALPEGAGDPARGPPNGPRDFPPSLRPNSWAGTRVTGFLIFPPAL